MRRQKRLRRAGFMLWAAVFATAALLGHALLGQAKNVVTVGRVHISCERRYTSEGEKNETVRYLSPGDVARERTAIHVEKGSRDACLRVKVLVCGGTAAQQRDLFKRLETDESWYYRSEDGYFYYKKPVAAGDVVFFSTRLQVPGQWSGLQSDLRFRTSLLVEAVEAQYVDLCVAGGCVYGWDQRLR